MTKKESAQLEELRDIVKDLHIAIVGNEEMGITGLARRQELDDEKWNRTNLSLAEINSALQSQINFNQTQLVLNKDTKQKIEEIDNFINGFRQLGKLKKRTIAFIISLLGIITALFSWWSEIKPYLHQFFIK